MAKEEFIYPGLSYKIIGILFEVHNDTGGGHRESYIQKAIELALVKEKIRFRAQLMVPLKYQNVIIGKYFLDFLIEDKIILEIKSGERFKKSDINQVYSYLQAKNLKLGILANFTKHKVRIKRIVNLR